MKTRCTNGGASATICGNVFSSSAREAASICSSPVLPSCKSSSASWAKAAGPSVAAPKPAAAAPVAREKRAL